MASLEFVRRNSRFAYSFGRAHSIYTRVERKELYMAPTIVPVPNGVAVRKQQLVGVSGLRQWRHSSAILAPRHVRAEFFNPLRFRVNASTATPKQTSDAEKRSDSNVRISIGFELMKIDVRISIRLLLKLAGGSCISRREKLQILRTAGDLFRFVQLAVVGPLIICLLPLYPNLLQSLLPSTFRRNMEDQERSLNAWIGYAIGLQSSVEKMGSEVEYLHYGENTKVVHELNKLLIKVRKGCSVSNEEILSFRMLFNYDLALDYISRARLANMCMFMGIRPFGTSSYLRFKLRRRLQNIRKDDRMIREEGVHTLTEEELSAACRARGMLWVLSLEEMRQQLCDWLDLSLDHWVPSSLLILSRAFTVRGDHTLVLQPHKREWTPQNEFNELSRALAILASESAETVGVVEDERVAEAASYLRSTLGDTGVEHLISYFGKLYAEDIVKLVNESKLHQD